MVELLHSRFYVMSSDEDQPIVDDLVVGFNALGGLVAVIERNGRRHSNPWTAAVLTPDETQRLARRLGIPPSELPTFIGEFMEPWSRIINPTYGQVAACLKDITERLLDEGCRFVIKRSPGRAIC